MEKELPIGWIETNLDTIIFQKKGKKPLRLEPVEFKNSVPYLDIHALERGIYRQYADINSSNIMDEEMIAIVWDGARSGWVSKGKFGAIGSTLAALKPINVDINYVFYFLQSNFSFINTNPRGIGIPHVDPTLLWNLRVPLPPLPEQQRIVAKLDTLFGHLDALKTRLDRIPQLLKDFRQKVLTQAVTGKLTEEWREGRELEKWQDIILKDFTDIDVGPAFKSAEFEDSGIRLLRGENIEPGALRWNNTVYFPEEKLLKFSHLFIKEGNVILAMDRPIISTGLKLAKAKKEDLPCVLVQRVARFRPSEKLSSGFLYFLISSDSYIKHLFGEQTGTQIPHISSKQILSFNCILPPLEEQQEIVRRVESLFAKADRIEASYQKLKAKIEALPQALLAKAFRGELVEQLPTDGDARDLLEQIKRAKEGLEKGGKSRKMKVEDEVRMVAEPGARYGKK